VVLHSSRPDQSAWTSGRVVCAVVAHREQTGMDPILAEHGAGP
jgi:hypothetical protein